MRADRQTDRQTDRQADHNTSGTTPSSFIIIRPTEPERRWKAEETRHCSKDIYPVPKARKAVSVVNTIADGGIRSRDLSHRSIILPLDYYLRMLRWVDDATE